MWLTTHNPGDPPVPAFFFFFYSCLAVTKTALSRAQTAQPTERASKRVEMSARLNLFVPDWPHGSIRCFRSICRLHLLGAVLLVPFCRRSTRALGHLRLLSSLLCSVAILGLLRRGCVGQISCVCVSGVHVYMLFAMFYAPLDSFLPHPGWPAVT